MDALASAATPGQIFVTLLVFGVLCFVVGWVAGFMAGMKKSE